MSDPDRAWLPLADCVGFARGAARQGGRPRAGEVSTAALAAYGRRTPTPTTCSRRCLSKGPAQLSAWCAFVLQTHADNLIASGSAPGSCADQEALEEASSLYQLPAPGSTGPGSPAATPSTRWTSRIPQPYIRPHGPQGSGEVGALRATVATVQSRLGAELAERRDEPVAGRLRPPSCCSRARSTRPQGSTPGTGRAPS